ncbi:MAG: ABC transporter ATP-binding protein [Nitrososphaeria archaeon]|nr:ABC transporter ATP-binding protein [Aigarchaeota archaeon]MCX8187300.1 ABC transporter ATP-binding protein [Nitrososphaeria archaeon]MDW8021415.1 ABC transporter ATP-binding protein [Nitrososphaerota archaeon]
MEIPAIKFDNVWKIYRMGAVEVPALKGLSIEIRRGEHVAVMGPSGSGKSTFLHLAGALDKPTKGRILIEGRDPNKLSDGELSMLRNKYIGFVFQTFNLIPRLTALQNVMLPLILRGVDGVERVKRAKEALERVGLGHRINHRPTEMSGGEQQRVAMARAIVTDPKIILADEPTGNLDSASAAEIVNLLTTLNRDLGITLVVVTHNPEAAAPARRIVRIRDGVVYEGN